MPEDTHIENLPDEIWKDAKNFEGYYQVSNYGRIKTIPRKVKAGTGHRIVKSKIKTPLISGDGYLISRLYKNNREYCVQVHQLVAFSFIGDYPHEDSVIDHIDFDKTNARLDNLRFISNRENVIRSINRAEKKAPLGVYLIPAGRGRLKNNRWASSVKANNIKYYLGCFETAELASQAYQQKIAELGLI